MTEKRPPKKSDHFQVRLPPDLKRAFLDACRRNGRAASEVIREFVESYVRWNRLRDRLASRRSLAMVMSSPAARAAAAAAVVAAVLTYLAAGPSSSVAQPDLRAVFAELDADGDGRVSNLESLSRAPWLGPSVWMLPATADAAAARVLVRDDVEELWFPAPSLAESDFILIPASNENPPFDETMNYARQRLFSGYDVNGDGAIDFEEYQSRYAQMIEATFARFDSDGDQRITADEAAEAVADFEGVSGRWTAPYYLQGDHFTAVDRDGDGIVTPEEFSARPSPT